MMTDQPSPDPAPAADPATTPDPAPSPDPAPAPAWYDGLPEEVRSDPNIAKYHAGGLEMLARAHINASSLRGVPTDQLVKVPGATDADGVREYLGRLGLPDTADDYRLENTLNDEGEPLGDGYTTEGELAGVFGRACFEAGIPPQIAQQVYDQCNKWLFQKGQDTKGETAGRKEANIQALQRQHGAGLTAVSNAADFAAEQLGIFEVLEKSGIAHEPAIINALAKIAPLWSEASGQGGLPRTMGGAVSREQLISEAVEMEREAMVLKANDPRSKTLYEKALKKREQAATFNT